MRYRAEIDGLRALAVLPVILFHAGFDFFSGGFVGVDVFFVISGYLITTILIEDIENKRFSLVNFYERRARRILPVLFFVMLCCIPFAWMWMLPSQMVDFSQSVVAVSLFASNILLWLESGYFEAAAEEKPLLHTWSLAVEEQYYVIFPIFLFLAWRFGKNRVFWILVLSAVISLALSEWGWRNTATANFYLAPTRAWELFAGSIAAFIVQRRGVEKNDTLALVGLAAILFAIFAYDEGTPFPSIYALVPVLGVVLLVLYADKNTLAAKLLSIKIFVGIGLISYSAYLWHQPLFAFARLRSITAPSKGLMLLLSVMSVGLAVFSWKYVEQPFRRRNGALKTQKCVFMFSLFGLALLISVGWIGYVEDGFPNRFGVEYHERSTLMRTLGGRRQRLIRAGICHYNRSGKYSELDDFVKNWQCHSSDEANSRKPTIAVYGDSHSADKAMALRLNGESVTQLGGAGCPLIPQTDYGTHPYCNELLELFISEVTKAKYSHILLAARFEGKQLSPAYLQRVIDFWKKFDTQVMLFSAMPEFPRFAEIYAAWPEEATKMSFDVEKLEVFNEAARRVDLPRNIQIIDTKALFCSMSGDPCLPVARGEVLLTDYGHLSENGAKLFGAKLKTQLEGRVQ